VNVEEFRALHRPGDPLFLVNAWDLPSALRLHAEHPVVGTTSLGIACTAGVVDGTGASWPATRELLHRLRPWGVPVTVDLESGPDDDPAHLADVVAELAELGAVGLNLEDSRHGELLDADLAARKVAAARSAGIFVNARTDVHWLGLARTDGAGADAVDRLTRYVDAGADGVFLPGTHDPALIARCTATGVPVNVLAGPPLDRLAGLGVARVSTGSLLFRAAMGHLANVVDAARAGSATAPPYAEFVR
jgi:2-methylisocitrate lyase-like PEP mutase family enzyme